MHCSTCGAIGSLEWGVCADCRKASSEGAGAAESHKGTVAHSRLGPDRGAGRCPRCDYRGQGLAYFSSGPHLAALVGATVFTLPLALGSGGFLYYGLRHDHRICPRCGDSWGKQGERARVPPEEGVLEWGPVFHVPPGEGTRRIASIALSLVAVTLLAVGISEKESIVLALAVAAGGGGLLLHLAANRVREERRARLIAALQLPVIALAARYGGRLTVTEVAACLGWPLARAEKVLHSLDDGWRVSSEVTDEGVIVFEFRELILKPRPHA